MPVRIGHHEVDVQLYTSLVGERLEALDHVRTHAQVGDEVAIHHVDVQPRHLLVERVANLTTELEEVRGQDRGYDVEHGRSRCGGRSTVRAGFAHRSLLQRHSLTSGMSLP